MCRCVSVYALHHVSIALFFPVHVRDKERRAKEAEQEEVKRKNREMDLQDRLKQQVNKTLIRPEKYDPKKCRVN